ncbi:K-box domain-containing protein [Salmonella enterica subsp. enterica serovar Paratyphi A]
MLYFFFNSKLLGEGLGSCTFEELIQIEQQLEQSASTIRARKMQVFREQIEKLKEKEKALEAENAMLCVKHGLQPRKESNEDQGENEQSTETNENSDVETELFIGPPEGRTKRVSPPK